MGDVHQEVGGATAPREGDDVEIAIGAELSPTDVPAVRIVGR
jgi:hypothetical protein